MIGRSRIPLIGSVTVVTAIAAGAAVAFAPRLGDSFSVGAAVIALSAVAALIAVASLRASMFQPGDRPPMERFGSGLLALGVIVAVIVPGLQIAAGVQASKLADKGFPQPNIAAEQRTAYLIFAAALLAFLLGEWLVGNRSPARDRASGRRFKPPALDSRRTYFALLALGLGLAAYKQVFTETELTQGEIFVTRGEAEGQGVETLLSWAVPVAIASAVLQKHWGSRALAVLNVLLAAWLLSNGTRSPFVLIGVAALIRFARSAELRRRPLRTLGAAALAGYFGLVLIIGLATWRGAVITDPAASLPSSFVQAAKSPVEGIGGAGFDSLDGLILARQADRNAVDASWTDVSKVVTGFVPHQLWAETPEWLSVTVTHYYIKFGGSGIFMSGIGYASLIFGGLGGGLLLFVALGAASAAVYRHVSVESMLIVLWTYFIIRFFFAGDAFDAFHVLGLLLLLVFGAGLGVAAGLLGRVTARPAETGRPLPA